jgi:peptide/nickel transport system ATP-binding protein
MACTLGGSRFMQATSDLVPMGTSTLLGIRGLTVRYPAGGGQPVTPALHKVDLDIWHGQIVGILGESGAGKSTLASAILGLLPTGSAAEGSIRLHSQDSQSQDLLRMDESRWRTVRGAKIAMIFQEPGLCLNPVMRVGDQIAEVIRAHSNLESTLRKQECEAMLREVGFSDVERVYKAYPHQLSGGQLHRVAIAQALVCRPDLVIADEPTRSLDVAAQAEILNVLRETHRKFRSALIFITHNPALLAGFAHRVVILYGGHIVEEGPVAQVFRRPLHPYTKGLLQLFPGSQQHASLSHGQLPVIPGSLTDADHLTQGCIFEPRCSARTVVCHRESPPEEIRQDRRVSCFNHGN